MKTTSLRVTGGLLCMPVTSVWAHHAMGGETPRTVVEGLLSGIGHPIIGIDHLMFVVALGILAALHGVRHLHALLAFIVATVAGTLLHIAEADLAAMELAVALSLLVAGGVLALWTRPSRPLWTMLAGIAGVFHGYAYGEAIVGAERDALFAYIVGFCFIQAVICIGAYALARSMLRGRVRMHGLMARLGGVVVGLVGAVFAVVGLAV